MSTETDPRRADYIIPAQPPAARICVNCGCRLRLEFEIGIGWVFTHWLHETQGGTIGQIDCCNAGGRFMLDGEGVPFAPISAWNR